MQHVFVGFGGKIRPRWQEAFPEATSLTSLFELRPSTNGGRMVWFDVSNTTADERMAQVEQVITCGSPVIIMSSLPNDDEAYEMLKHGAYGYCHNVAAPSQLVEIAKVVENGGLWVGQGVMRRLVDIVNQFKPIKQLNGKEQAINSLTTKELAVAKQVAIGATNKEIADVLAMSERTVKAHLSSVFERLEVRDRVQLALTMNNIQIH
jgi:DNA-binding NarL/FixJ family response regulator